MSPCVQKKKKKKKAFASYLAEVVSFYRKEHNVTFR